MKYIVYSDNGHEVMVIFPRSIEHSRMKEALECLRFGTDRDWHRSQGEVLSAGFLDNGVCSGTSESLDITSRPDLDTDLYRKGGSSKSTNLI